jgi:hypothetical protein
MKVRNFTKATFARRWQSREEILNSHLDSLTPAELLEIRPSYYALRFGWQAIRRATTLKNDHNQPRVPAGSPDGGQWTSGSEQREPSSDVQEILVKAKRLAATRADMRKCLNLCSPLLDRFKSPGSDRNEFDFRKCLNACLGINR